MRGDYFLVRLDDGSALARAGSSKKKEARISNLATLRSFNVLKGRQSPAVSRGLPLQPALSQLLLLSSLVQLCLQGGKGLGLPGPPPPHLFSELPACDQKKPASQQEKKDLK